MSDSGVKGEAVAPMLENTPATDGAGRIWSAGMLRYTRNGLIVLFVLLLLGDFAWSMRDRSVGPMAAWFLDKQKVPSLVFGLLVNTFPALIGMVLRPVISVKSARHRGRWGRRIPFLLVTMPVTPPVNDFLPYVHASLSRTQGRHLFQKIA